MIALIWADALGLLAPPVGSARCDGACLHNETGSVDAAVPMCSGRAGERQGGAERAPATPEEVETASHVLNAATLGLGAQWFELGGDSAAAIRMLLALDRRLGELGLLPSSGVGGGGRIPGGGYSKAAGSSADRVRVWMCGLQRKPRLKEFCHFIQWSLTAAPGGGVPGHGTGETVHQTSRVQVADAWGSAVLARMDRELPVEEDQERMQAAALVIAASRGHTNVVHSLLTVSHAPPDGEWSRIDKAAPCPLLLAAEHGHVHVVWALRGAGASVGAVTEGHANGAQLAAARGHLCVVRALLAPLGSQKGIALQACDLNKWSILHYAASEGHASVIHEVLNGVPPAVAHSVIALKDRWSRTALAYSLVKGHPAAFEALRAHGACLGEAVLPRNRLDGWAPALLLAVRAIISRAIQIHRASFQRAAAARAVGSELAIVAPADEDAASDARAAARALEVVKRAISERVSIGCDVNGSGALFCVCAVKLRDVTTELELSAMRSWLGAFWRCAKESGVNEAGLTDGSGIHGKDISSDGRVDEREASRSTAAAGGSGCVWKVVKDLLYLLLAGMSRLPAPPMPVHVPS